MAFVYGSMARGEEHAHSDVDVMLVGDLDVAQVVLALSGAQEFLRREVNPIVLSSAEWDRKLAQADGFVAQIWQGSKLWLVEKA
jgi:predicted nucleotidyltransferase